MNYQRDDVEFRSKTDLCRAWLYRPAGRDAPAIACIVLAHGLGGTRDAGLEPYAQRFAAAGYMALVFDYRHFGVSDGLPRQLLSVKRQLQDWAAAIAYARTLPGVDPAKIALWGTSFSGGHVIVAAARDGRVAAISAQCPMMDGRAALRRLVEHAGIGRLLQLIAVGTVDALGGLLGQPPVYIPVSAPPGQVGLMTTQDAVDDFKVIVPPTWINQAAARFVLGAASYRPISHARSVTCPVLIQVCKTDSVAPASAAYAIAEKLGPKVQLEEYDCGHFAIYVGKDFERSSGEQLAFFDRVLRA